MKISLLQTISADHMELKEYCMDNGIMSVHVLSYGCALTGIYVPDKRTGEKINILLSFDNLTSYLHNPLYCGAALGPNAGRISGGTLYIDDKHYQLSQNDGAHHIHGGFHNLSFQNAALVSRETDLKSAALTFQTVLPHGLDGYPGHRCIHITYRLFSDNRLTVSFRASSDRETYFNLFSHAYFNLSGDFTKNVHDHRLFIRGNAFVENDETHIPMGMSHTNGTPFDFSAPVSIQENIDRYPQNVQIQRARGLNHAFLSNKGHNYFEPSLVLEDHPSGRSLKLYTDTPSIVVYSGGFIENTYKINGGCPSSPHCAIALEPQDIPDTPNCGLAPLHIVKPGALYLRTFTYAFSF